MFLNHWINSKVRKHKRFMFMFSIVYGKSFGYTVKKNCWSAVIKNIYILDFYFDVLTRTTSCACAAAYALRRQALVVKS